MKLSWRSDGPADAPPLVLLNSVGSSTAMWEPCVAPLAEQFRMIRIDARGHGASPPSPEREVSIAGLGADVEDTLDDLGLDRVDLAGLSIGGMVGMWLAIHRPERIHRLGLLCTAALLPPPQFWLDRARSVRTGGMASIADGVVARWITPGLADRDPELIAKLRAMFTANDAESYAQCCAAIAAMDQRADLGRIAAPTLVIGGADDPATPIALQQEIVDGIPGSRLAVVRNAAHIAPVEQPAHVAALLREHFGGGATLTAGYATRRAVLGDEHVDRTLERSTEFDADFQAFLTRYAWGEVWSRPGLSRRERSIITLTALVTLGAEHELVMHVRGAVRNGLSADEIGEVLLQSAIYAGVPRANRAFTIARETLADAPAVAQRKRRNRSELPTTNSELAAIARPASSGESSPSAATGINRTL